MYLHDLKTGQLLRQIGTSLQGSVSSVTTGEVAFFFSLTSFTHPSEVYRYSFADGQLGKFRADNAIQDAFTTEQLFYEATDSTPIPMHIISPRTLPPDQAAPVILHGYGGFGLRLDPFYSPAVLTLCERYGMRFAIAHVRGGGEYGGWHEAGRREKRQVVFDDFHSAAQYLLDHNIATPGKICAYGLSNGGTLVAACAAQKPKLYGCIVGDVGLYDMLRYHRWGYAGSWVCRLFKT